MAGTLYSYEIYLDVDRDALFANGLGDVTEFVEDASWRAGATSPYETIAPSSDAAIILNNSDGRFSLHNPSAIYYGLITTTTLVRMRCTYQGTTETMFVLRVDDIIVDPVGANPNPKVTLRCTDLMKEFLEAKYDPILQTNVRVDEVLTEISTKSGVIWPFDSAFFYIGFDSIGGTKNIFAGNDTDFDPAFTTLAYAGDNNDKGSGVTVHNLLKDFVNAEFSGLFFFQPRTQKLIFFSRYHQTFVTYDPLVLRTSSYTFTMEDIVSVDQRYGDEMINDFSLSYEPRSVGSAGTVIYDSDKAPFSINSFKNKKVSMRYHDPNNEAKVGAFDVIVPQKGIDLIANTAADGSGDDVSAQVGYSIDIGADKATIELIWTGSNTVYVTKLQIKGTPLYRDSQTISATNDQSIYDHGRKTKKETIRSISDDDTAQTYVDFMINTFSDPKAFIRKVSFIAKEDQTALQFLQRTMGDLITIEDELLVQTVYMIAGEAHDVDVRSGQHRVTWVLRPKDVGSPFIIGSSEIDGPDLILV